MSAVQKIENLNSGISALDHRLWPESTTNILILAKFASSVKAGK